MIVSFIRRWHSRIGVATDVAAVFAGRIGGIAVSLFFIPIYTRLLSPSDFGVVALLLSLQSFFLVSDLGLATVLARDTAIARGNAEALAAATDDRRRAEIIMAALVSLVSLMVMIALVARGDEFSSHTAYRIATGAALIMLLVLLNISQLCLNALGHYQLTSILTTVGTIMRAAGAALALGLISASIDTFLWAQLLIAAVHYLVVRTALDKKSGSIKHDLRRLLNRSRFTALLARSKSVMIYALGSAAALNLDKSILAAFLPIKMTGLYFLATTYALVPISLLSGPLNQYFAPRIAHAEGQKDRVMRWRLATSFQILLAASVVIPAFILISHAQFFLSVWLHGNPEIPRILPLATTLLVGTAIGATGYYPTTYLIAVADNRFLARLSILAAIMVLSAAVVCAKANSLIGVAASYAVFHVSGCVVQWLRLRTHWGKRAFHRLVVTCYFAPIGALLAICFLVHAIVNSFVSGVPALLIGIGLQSSLGGIAMAIMAGWCYRRTATLNQVFR